MMIIELTPIGTKISFLNQIARKKKRDEGISLSSALDNVAFEELQRIDAQTFSEHVSERASRTERTLVRPKDCWPILRSVCWLYDKEGCRLFHRPHKPSEGQTRAKIDIRMSWEPKELPGFCDEHMWGNLAVLGATANVERHGPGRYFVACEIGDTGRDEVYANKKELTLLSSSDELTRAAGWIGLYGNLVQLCKDTAKTHRVDPRAALEMQMDHLHSIDKSELLFEIGPKDGSQRFFAGFLTTGRGLTGASVDLMCYAEGFWEGYKAAQHTPQLWNSLVAGLCESWTEFSPRNVEGLTLNIPTTPAGFNSVCNALFEKLVGDKTRWFYEEAPWLLGRVSSNYQRVSDIADGVINGRSVVELARG